MNLIAFATTWDVMHFEGFKLYKSFGPLIKDYRRWRGLSQETLAKRIGISLREFQRWETDRRRILIENLHDLSEVTGIPMQVCIALNADQPLWYLLRQRRFAYSSMDARFLFHEVLRYRKQSDDEILLKCDRISTDRHISTILSCHKEIYGTEKPLGRDVIKKAITILPGLNCIVFDSWGHYVGHNVCLPIKLDTYQQIKKQKTSEDYLTTERMNDILALHEGCFFYYSSFANSVNVAHCMNIGGVRYLAKIEQKEGYLVAVHSALIEAKKYFDRLGMRMVKSYGCSHDTVFPKIYEVELDVLMRPSGPWRWILKEECDKAGPENFIVKAKREAYGPLMVDKTRNEACPNPKCALYGETGKGNIVSNGTYRRKEGVPGRRFLCKECGESFCTRVKTIFYDIRSPEEKVLMALKLLVKGMSLRGVAEVLGVKRDTVRHWLEVAAEESGKIDAMLRKELKVSQVKLDALWTFVKKDSLRQRATLR